MMIFKFLNKIFNKNKINDERPKLLEFTFDNEKILALYDNMGLRTIYYHDLKNIFIIFYDEDNPIPLWNFVSEEYYISVQNDFPIDFKKLINTLTEKLTNFDNTAYEQIINAMGASNGLFHIWNNEKGT